MSIEQDPISRTPDQGNRLLTTVMIRYFNDVLADARDTEVHSDLHLKIVEELRDLLRVQRNI